MYNIGNANSLHYIIDQEPTLFFFISIVSILVISNTYIDV